MQAPSALPIRIRLANEDDAAGALSVYAPYIPTPVTFEEVAPSLEEFRARMAAVLGRYPYLVAVADDGAPGRAADATGSALRPEVGDTHADAPVPSDGAAPSPDAAPREHVVGYAYAHAQHERAAYGWNAELSVYLAREAQGCGLGGALYRALVDLVRLQGVKAAYALVTVPNEASERLHATLGFRSMGLQRNAGYTCDAWRDVAWLVKQLAPFDADPQPVLPFPALAATQPEAVRAVLARANASLAHPAMHGGQRPAAHGQPQPAAHGAPQPSSHGESLPLTHGGQRPAAQALSPATKA